MDLKAVGVEMGMRPRTVLVADGGFFEDRQVHCLWRELSLTSWVSEYQRATQTSTEHEK